jgi:hypothetical protein
MKVGWFQQSHRHVHRIGRAGVQPVQLTFDGEAGRNLEVFARAVVVILVVGKVGEVVALRPVFREGLTQVQVRPQLPLR